MKFLKYIIITLITIPSIFSQNTDRKHYSFYALKLDSIVLLKPNFDSINTSLKVDTSISSYDLNLTDFKIDSEKLNKKLFTNFKYQETNYIDVSDYLRGCGPLEDGITNSINSGELMLSNIIDNFVNNYVFKGKGVFFKN